MTLSSKSSNSERRPSSVASVPRPAIEATCLLLAGLAVTGLTANGQTPAAFVRYAAIGVGLSLLASMAIEFKNTWNNLLRADLVALVALYFLLFFEFLFPQRQLNELVTFQEEIEKGVSVCIWAFAAMAIGRHLLPGAAIRRWRVAETSARPGTMVRLFWLCFAFGFLPMALAVNFNPVELVSQFFEPRFTQPWGREQFGDWHAMLYETGCVLFLVPPLAGVMLGRRKHYTRTQLVWVFLGLLFTLIYGFSSGTRNLISSYLITFVASFFYASGAALTREVIVSCALAFAVFLASAFYGIDFRNVGLKNYLRGARANPDEEAKSLFVDYNIYALSRLTTIFPHDKDYIGSAVPLWILARPVPRVLWPGKPDGTQVSVESALGEEGLTIACTFIGECYMAAGLFGVVLAGLAIGLLARWWTCKAYSLASDFGILIYTSGFFSVVISMRSIYMLFVAILPTLAICLVGLWLVRHPQARVLPGRAHALRAGIRTRRSSAQKSKIGPSLVRDEPG